MMLQHVLDAGEAAEVLVADDGVDLLVVDELERELLLPAHRLQAQGRVRLVLDVVAAFDARDAVVVGADHHLRGRTVLGGLARGQVLDDGAQYLDAHLGLVAAQVLVGGRLLRCQQGHDERGQKQGYYDHAAGHEYHEVALRHRVGYGERHGQRDGSFRAAQGHDGSRAHVLQPERAICAFGAAVHPFHGHHPNESCEDHDEGETQHVRDELVVRNGRAFPCSLKGERQLRAQQHEHHAVEREGQHPPDACRDDVHARDGRPDDARRDDVHETCRHHGQDAARVQRVGHKVHDERREHLEQHVEGRVLQAPRANLAH